MKIINLVDDHLVKNQLESEHGLSFYIQMKNHNVLFDMGQSGIFTDNAKKLGIDLSEVDVAIISHGHYDHGGGLNEFFNMNQKANVYIQEEAFNDYYSLRDKDQVAYVGLNKSFKDHPRIKLLNGDYDISPHLHLIQDVKPKTMFPKANQSLFKELKDLSKPDDFAHEQSLLIEEEGKHVLISGCSHKGVLNIIDAVSKKFNLVWLNAVIGGFHLKSRFKDLRYAKAEIIQLAKALKDKSKSYFTGHCTGEKEYKIIKKELKNQVNSFYPGWEFQI